MTTRYLRSEETMAFPQGRLLAATDSRLFVLAPDGWDLLGGPRPRRAASLSREEAEDWCEREGWDLNLLDALPAG